MGADFRGQAGILGEARRRYAPRLRYTGTAYSVTPEREAQHAIPFNSTVALVVRRGGPGTLKVLACNNDCTVPGTVSEADVRTLANLPTFTPEPVAERRPAAAMLAAE